MSFHTNQGHSIPQTTPNKIILPGGQALANAPLHSVSIQHRHHSYITRPLPWGARLTLYAWLLVSAGLLLWGTVSIVPQCVRIVLQALPLLPLQISERGFTIYLLLALLVVQLLTWPALWIILLRVSIAFLRMPDHPYLYRRGLPQIDWRPYQQPVDMTDTQDMHAQPTIAITPLPRSARQAPMPGQAIPLPPTKGQRSPYWTFASESFWTDMQ